MSTCWAPWPPQVCNNGIIREGYSCHSADSDKSPHLNITYPCSAALARVKVRHK